MTGTGTGTGTGPRVTLPGADGTLEDHRLAPARGWDRPSAPFNSRVAYAAAHVVPVVTAETAPGAPAVLDWDSTLGFRHHLWSLGLGVAEAMDTAQRGMGLDWPAAAELIRRSSAEAASVGGTIACGAGTDEVLPAQVAGADPAGALRTVTDAYRGQLDVVGEAGARPILMASRALAAAARDADDYRSVYSDLLSRSTAPVILHWLGEAFDPQLAGYWGHDDPYAAAEVLLDLVREHRGAVDGMKISLLDADLEIWVRERLPEGVRMYTGDDYNYPDLVVGDERGHSDALLGIFAAIAPAASHALSALDAGDTAGAHATLASTQALGRHVFAAPTFYYKTGVAFLAWLNGHQPGFQMVGGLQSGRSVPHLVELVRLADAAGLLTDPDLAATRMTRFLDVAGIGAGR
ncbi:dihydrodipicolinate synthase family protein [Georgenia sp. Z1344]|uniref:dihydrodipicolinate synthase family protein n=1 Tax=Georgenia sp. Z1344 TaxID=3416706 RepID=UPI003CF2E94B